MKNEAVLILDFGGQYSQLIARRVRDLNVYCEIKPYRMPAAEIQAAGYRGVIFSGGPNSVYGENAPVCDKDIFLSAFPYLASVMARSLWRTVWAAKSVRARFASMARRRFALRRACFLTVWTRRLSAG